MSGVAPFPHGLAAVNPYHCTLQCRNSWRRSDMNHMKPAYIGRKMFLGTIHLPAPRVTNASSLPSERTKAMHPDGHAAPCKAVVGRATFTGKTLSSNLHFSGFGSLYIIMRISCYTWFCSSCHIIVLTCPENLLPHFEAHKGSQLPPVHHHMQEGAQPQDRDISTISHPVAQFSNFWFNQLHQAQATGNAATQHTRSATGSTRLFSHSELSSPSRFSTGLRDSSCFKQLWISS